MQKYQAHLTMAYLLELDEALAQAVATGDTTTANEIDTIQQSLARELDAYTGATDYQLLQDCQAILATGGL